MTTVILGKDITRGGLIDPDAAAHVMDGVLIHDWILAGPKAWLEPMDFAVRQYAHYPTLGIGGHYPPGFAAVEAIFFLVMGVSVTTARICVVFFGLLAASGCYALVRQFADRNAALISAILLMAVPASTQWGRQAMLEVPLMASLLWAGVAFFWYLRAPSWPRLALVCLSALITLAFKQTGVFLICAMAMTLTIHAFRRTWVGGKRPNLQQESPSIPWGHASCAILIGIGALAGILMSMDDACLKTVSGYNTHAPLSVASLLFYPRSFSAEAGAPVLVGALAGFAIAFFRRDHEWWFLSSWLFISLVMVTVASLKTPRFGYVCLPPIVVWGGLAVSRIAYTLPLPWARTVLVGGLVLYIGWAGFRRPVEGGPDFGPLVQAHRDRIANQAVLFSGLRDGDFVLAVREHVPWRSAAVVRGSKLFYTCVARPDLDLVSRVKTQHELGETMRRFAFGHVFVERDNRVSIPQEDWLRAYLRDSGDYRLVGGIPVEQGSGCTPVVMVDVYELARPMERQVEYFEIPIPRTKSTIKLDFRTLFPSGRSS